MSAEEWGRGIPHRTINKQAGQPGAGKLVKAVMGGKLHRRGRKTHFLCEL
jgi:hypothetical protein